VSHWDQLWQVFHRIREAGPSERASLLEALCGADAQLRAQVDELLRAGDAGTSPLDRAPLMGIDRDAARQVLCDRFEIVGPIGAGYHEALDRARGSRVALTVLKPAGDARGRQRFYADIERARQIEHPNLCRLYALFEHRGDDEPLAFVTMELLHGESLADRLRRGGLTSEEALELAEQVGAALAAAHACGVVHGELRGDDVILAGQRIVVRGLGLRGRTGSVADDVYAFGLLLQQSTSTAGGPWESTIVRCLKRDPHDRFRSAVEVVESLSGTKSRARWWR
jgi:tRNA A-37 threonylcarbamoyl transferase component Bud32